MASATETHMPASRAQLLLNDAHFGAALLQLESSIETKCSLDAAVREVAILTVLRRSRIEIAVRTPVSKELGISSNLIEAILAEDWTDPAFSPLQKAAFQFALQYDAGHLIHKSVLESMQAQFKREDIVELALICGHYGSMARLAVGFQLQD